MFVARAAGYAVVGVNLRGTGCSGGAFSYWEALQGLDGYDVTETVAAQPWAERVVMIGLSYPGIAQLFVAATQPPSLAAISPFSTIADTYRSSLYPGGILNEGHSSWWAAERDAEAEPRHDAWVRNRIDAGDTTCEANQLLHSQYVPILPQLGTERFYEASGDSLAPRTFVDRISVPTFFAQSWQDEQTGSDAVNLLSRFTGLGGPGEPPLRAELLNGAHAEPYTPELYLRLFEFLDLYVARRVPQLVGPLRSFANVGFANLVGVPGVDLPPNRTFPDDYEEALAFYEAEPPVRVNFEHGAAGADGDACPDQDGAPDPCPAGYPYAGFDHQFESWPPPETEATRLYFQPDGALGDAPPVVADDAPRGHTTYRYDGAGGGQMVGATRGFMHPDPGWQWPQYPEHQSSSFVSPPLTEDLAMAGTGSVDLWLRSTAPDVDLEVDLTEVRPDGKETYVQSGWLRASRRALDPTVSTELYPFPTQLAADAAPLPAGAAPLPAGAFVAARVGIHPFAHVFRVGSRIRITVEAPGGNRPQWGFANLTYPEDQLVDVAHSSVRPSSVVLPVLPTVAVPTGLAPCGSLRSQPCRDFLPSRAPTGVTTAVVDRQVEVSWTPPATEDAVTGYTVAVAPTGETFPVAASATSFTCPSPDPGTRYSFTVTAGYADGDGPPSTSSDVSPGPAGFSDVRPTSWFSPGVDWTTAYGVLSGFPGGTFKAAEGATRAQVAMALWNLAGRPAAAGDGASYADVPAGARYHAALDWMDDAGIDSAFADRTFRPRATVNRARLAVWMHRASGALAGSVPNTYDDVPDAAWYAGAVDWWQAHDLGAGGPASAAFKPRATVKRSQLAGWLWNLARTDAAWGTPSPW